MRSESIDAPLDWQAVARIASGAPLSLSQAAVTRIEFAKTLVSAIVAQRIRSYGINTGVGALSEVLVDESRQSALSHNIIMSHACGIGAALSVAETRAIMACAINNFAHGGSGVRPALVKCLVGLLNANLIPVIPRGGSIGYITQMAHVALVLLGSGSVQASDGIVSGAQALERLGIAPLILESKEGLSLVNGTPCSSGLACVALHRMHALIEWADLVAAMTFENIGTQPLAFAADALSFRVSDGIKVTGERLRSIMAGSEIIASARELTQDAMSLRAVPQVHGAVRECLAATCEVVDRELASVTDNPIVSGSVGAPLAYSQAHAVGTGLALAMDSFAIAIAKLAAISERRIDRLVNPLVSRLPAFLARDAGVSTGFMIAQYTALALTSENRRLAAPSSLDGGVSSGLQEDEIPHATTGALRALDIVENLETILAIELLAACQAYEFQKPALRRAPATNDAYLKLRAQVPAFADDRPFAVDIAAAITFIRKTAPPEVKCA